MDIRSQLTTDLVLYTTQSTTPVTSDNTSHHTKNTDISNPFNSLQPHKPNIYNLLYIPHITEGIITYLAFKDILAFRAINKECREMYHHLFHPKIAEEKLKIYGKNIKKGELYFPFFLISSLISNNIQRQISGLLSIILYTQEFQSISENILKNTIIEAKKDLYSNWHRKKMLANFIDEEVQAISNRYEKIFSAASFKNIGLSQFKTSLKKSTSTRGSIYSCLRPSRKSISYSYTYKEDIKNLEKNYISGSAKLVANTIKFLLIIFTLKYLTSTSLFIDNIGSKQIASAEIINKYLTTFTHILCLTLFFCIFEYFYTFPKSIDRFEKKLEKFNNFKNSFSSINSEVIILKHLITGFAQQEQFLLNLSIIKKQINKTKKTAKNFKLEINKIEKTHLFEFCEKILTIAKKELNLHEAIQKSDPSFSSRILESRETQKNFNHA